ncbi:hypothetical protein ACH4TX_28290 [Streptomyces sp. NPDC021098]|uniref:hypothetical protein n=1 Tax=unclassified Streptomyces TaxID=2593676 RepID=UPI0037A92866
MLTYHDVTTTKFSLLGKAATKWDEAAKKFESAQKTYDAKVKSLSADGSWNGQSAIAAQPVSVVTSGQYTAAAKEARAIASILRDAQDQFVDLRAKLKSAVADAVKAGMKVSEDGIARYDYDKASEADANAARHDPDMHTVEQKWTKHISKVVEAFDDTDRYVKLALKQAVEDPDALDGVNNGFNNKALGDIEAVEGKKASDLAMKLNSGDLDEKGLAELKRLERENKGDKDFSQTFLASLGPKGTINYNNKLADLAGDKEHGKDYRQLRDSLATNISSATKVPKFKGADGKELRFGSKEYSKAYSKWLKSSDGNFYEHFRKGLQKAGVEKYDLNAVTEKEDSIGRYHGQQVRGYQSLITLMKHGDGYSTQFLSDLGDDIRSAEDEKKGGDPDIWDLYGKFGNKKDGQFAQDPMDGLLGIMSHQPDASAAFLDPNSDPNPGDGKAEKNDRLEYLVKDRDWKVTNTTTWTGNIENTGDDTTLKDPHKGFDAALKAAATGRLPDSNAATDPPNHSAANAAVMHEAVRLFGDDPSLIKKDGDFTDLRRSLGEMTADYTGDVQRAITSDDDLPLNGASAKLGNVKLEPFLETVGRDPHAYGAITAAQQAYTANQVDDVINGHSTSQVSLSERINTAVSPGAVVAGIMSEGRAEGIHEEHIADDKEFNEKAGLASKWANRFIGVGIGAGLERNPAAAPIAEPIGWIQEDLNESIMKSIERDTTEKAQDEAGYDFSNGRKQALESARFAVQHAAERSDLDKDTINDLKDAAGKQAGNSHGEGSNWQQARNGNRG